MEANLATIDAWGFTLGTAAERVAIGSPRTNERFLQTDAQAGMWIYLGAWIPPNAVYCADDGHWYAWTCRKVGDNFEYGLDTDNPLNP